MVGLGAHASVPQEFVILTREEGAAKPAFAVDAAQRTVTVGANEFAGGQSFGNREPNAELGGAAFAQCPSQTRVRLVPVTAQDRAGITLHVPEYRR